MSDKARNIYDKIINSKVASEEELGTPEMFTQYVSSPDNASKIYQKLLSKGLSELELGTQDMFVSAIVPKSNVDVKASTAQSPSATIANTGIKAQEQTNSNEPLKKQGEEKGDLWIQDLGDKLNQGSANIFGGVLGWLGEGEDLINKGVSSAVTSITGKEYAIQPQTGWFAQAANYFKQDAERSGQAVNRFDGKSISEQLNDKEYGAFASQILLEGASSLPTSIGMILAPQVFVPTTIAYSSNLKYDELKERDDLSTTAKLTNAVTTGLIEAATERLGSIPVGGWLKSLYFKGAETGTKVFKKTLTDEITKLYKRYGLLLAPVGEGVEEAVGQAGENFTDWVTGATDKLDLTKGTAEAFAFGVGGGAYFTALGVPGTIRNEVQRNKIETNTKRHLNEVLSYTKEGGLAEEAVQRVVLNAKNNTIKKTLEETESVIQLIKEENGFEDVELSDIHEKLLATVYGTRKLHQYYDRQSDAELLLDYYKDKAKSDITNLADEDGNITKVTLSDGRVVDVVSGKVKVNENGQINFEESSPTLIVSDESGKRIPVQTNGSALRVESLVSQTPAQQEVENVTNTLQQKYEMETKYPVGTVVYVTDEQGNIIQNEDGTNQSSTIKDYSEDGVIIDTDQGEINLPFALAKNSLLTESDVKERLHTTFNPDTEVKSGNGEGFLYVKGIKDAVGNTYEVSMYDNNREFVDTIEMSGKDIYEFGKNKMTEMSTKNEGIQPVEDGKMTEEGEFEQKIEQITFPTKKEGGYDFTQFTPEHHYLFAAKTEGDKVANQDLKTAVYAALGNIQKQQDKINKAPFEKKAALRAELLLLKSKHNDLKALEDKYIPKEEDKPIQKRKKTERKTESEGIDIISSRWDDAKKTEGIDDEIVLANGENIKGRYYLVEPMAMTPSHDPETFNESEGFPTADGRTVNDRDYKNDKNAQVLVAQRANRYDSQAIQTPVIVSKDGVVLSGNDRTMAGQLAAKNNTDTKYVEYVQKYGKKYGFTAEQISEYQHPRIVFVPDVDMPYTTETFAKFNAEDKKTQSKTEQAVKISKTINEGTIIKLSTIIEQFELLSELYASTSATNDIISILEQDGVIGANEIAKYKDGDLLSETGKELVETILAGSVLKEDAIRVLAEMKGVRQSIVKSIVGFVANRKLSSYALTEELNDAIKLIYQVNKEMGKMPTDADISMYMMQPTFGSDFGDNASDLYSSTVQIFAKGILKGQNELKRLLSIYNQKAELYNAGQIDAFEGLMNKEELITAVLKRLGYENIEQGTKRSNTSKETTNIAASNAGDRGSATEQPLKESKQTSKEDKRTSDEKALDESVLSQAHNNNPTEKQKETGVYDKARINVQGYNITLETLKGQERKGIDSNGKAWAITMNNHYGELDGTIGYDGDAIDVFVGPNPKQGQIFVVDQVTPEGVFDESKVMLGFDTAEQAKAAYISNYEEGWQGFGSITPAGDKFKQWLYDGKKQRKPFAEYVGTPAPVENSINIAESIKTDAKEIKRQELTEERKQRILSEGTGFDKKFGLIPVSEIKSAAEIQANIEKIIATLKENEGNKKFDSFEGFAYGGKYAKNAGEQIKQYLISIDVLPLDIRKEFAERIGVTNNDELVSWGEKKYNELNQSEQPLSVEEQEIVDTDSKIQNIVEQPKITATDEKIEDVGQKIGGAKKDLFQEYAKKLLSVTDQDIARLPLSKSFPRPNFAQLIEDGKMTQETAIFLNYFYDNIPSKPQKSYKVERWVKTVREALDTFNSVLESKPTRDLMQEYIDMLNTNIVGQREAFNAEVYRAVRKAINFPNNDVNVGNLTILRSRTVENAYVYSVGNPIGNRVKLTGRFNTMEEAAAKLIEMAKETAGKPKQIEFSVYSSRSRGDFYITPKGKGEIVLQNGFKTSKEAFEYINENREALTDRFNAMKEIPSERRMSNRERVGFDYRQGKNVTAEDFKKEFGFRGVEFGNWVNQEERQAHINEAYDALMDLASVIGVTPRALSLNGELGFAFGSRGGGKYAAHYETNKVVINLTKTKGAGTLAHEWFHALDNYLLRAVGNRTSYATDGPGFNKEGKPALRPELNDAFRNLMKVIRKSGFYTRSAKLDKVKGSKYWGTSVELGARGFEDFVMNKLAKSNIQNDYLVNFKSLAEFIDRVNGDISEITSKYPYPTMEESEAISEAYQNLFDTIQEDDNGVLFQAVSQIGFYSTVEKALEAIHQERGTKEQFKQMLLKNGAKQAEMDWMGFDELPEKLTKADIQNWIDVNRIDVKEVVKGDESEKQKAISDLKELGITLMEFPDGTNFYNEDGEVVEVDELTSKQKEAAKRFYAAKLDTNNTTKFSQYVLPGGENYKEFVLTMPDQIEPYKPDSIHFTEEGRGTAVVWVRANEREVNEERVLFLEEIQSKRGQDGREKGFKGDTNYDAVLEKENVWDVGGIKVLYFERGVDGKNYRTINKNREQVWFKTLDDAVKQANETVINTSEKEIFKVPSMPFKKTDQWVNLALRRMMRYAAENGFDRIAWTNGEQQAERYDLSKQIDRVQYYKSHMEGRYGVVVWKGNDIIWKNPTATPEVIKNTIGKELASNIIKDAEEETKTYSGLDLKVGGEGMKAFYSAIVPSAMNKLGKPFGAKVEAIEIPETGLQQSIPVTDSMKQTAMAGLPLYHTGTTMQPTTPEEVAETVEQLLKTGLAKDVRMVTTEEIAGILEGNEQLATDRAGNEIGDGSWNVQETVFNFEQFPQVTARVDKSATTETTYVKYTNSENGKSITVRFSNHENNAVKFGDQLDGNFATGDQVLFHLGLKTREFTPDKYLSIWTTQVAKKNLDQYEQADKTIQELYAMGANADISEYKGKLAKGSNFLILGDKVNELTKTKRNIFGQEVEIGTFNYKDVQFLRTPTGTIYGFVKNGIVYINSKTPNLNTPIHEFGHLWIDTIEGSELYNRGTELVKNTPYWERVNADPNYSHLSENARVKEAMAMAIGDKGEAVKRDVGKFARIITWINDVWKRIGAKFGIQNLTPEQIQNLTFNDFVEVAVSELLSGESLTPKGQQKTKLPATIDVDGIQRPTTNSNGEPIHSTEEGIRNFWRWFSNSKVTDESGQPLVVYHGTKDLSDFSVFDYNKAGKGNDWGLFSRGFYFTPNKKTADQYRGIDGNIYVSYLSIKNPLYLNNFENKKELSDYLDIDEGIISDSSTGYGVYSSYVGTFTSHIKEKGHDGVIIIPKNGNSIQEIVAYFPTQIKSATGNFGSFDPSNADIRYQIIGERGASALDAAEEATARLDNLRVAKEMEDANKTPKEIRLATGWEKGVDGLWRYEVADGKLKTKGDFIIKKLKLFDWKYNTANQMFETHPEIKNEYENLEDWLDGKRHSLGNVWDSKELFEAYPKLKTTGIIYDGVTPNTIKTNTIASYNPERNEIVVHRLENVNSNVLHEIQHAIQEIEGFAKGGNEITALTSTGNEIALKSVALNTVNKVAKNNGYNLSEEQKQKLAEQVYLWDNADDNKLSEIQKEIGLNDEQIADFFNKDAFEIYRRLSGETESRNAQTRMNFTPDERRQRLLSETADVAPEDQIILMDSIGVNQHATTTIDGDNANILFEPQQLFIDFTKNETQDETRKAHGSEKKQQESVIETINNATLLPTNGAIASVSRHTSKRRSVVSSKRTVIDGFRESGYVNFNGTQVNTHQDIADLWSVHRSPYIEKTHIIFLKDGLVVGTMAHTAGKIDTAPIASVNEITDYAAQLGATQIYMLHNHPSGNPTPSLQDVKVTYHIEERLREYGISLLGQVVVDHDKYSFIDTANKPLIENLNESSLEYALQNNTEYHEYKSEKTDFLLERELIGRNDPQQSLFEYGKKLLSQPEYKAAVVYLSTDPSGKGFVVSAYDALAENTSKEEILSIINEGLNENIGRNAVIIHDGSIKGGFGKVHAKLLDIISIQTGGFANDFVNEEVSYGEKQALWISEQQNYQYANEERALAYKDKVKQGVKQEMLNATLSYPEYVEIDHVEESSIIPERPVYVKGESAYEYMQKLKEYEDNLHAVDSGIKEAYQEALANTYSKTQQLKRAHIDEVSPIEQLNDFIRKQGGEINADADAYIDYFNSKGRATYFTTKFDTEYMQKLVDTFVQVRKSGELDVISAKWADTGKSLSNYEKMHVYLQAKDIEEGIALGLVDRGESGFANSIGITHTEYITMFEDSVSKEHIDAMWKAVNDVTRFSLDYQLNADMISKETYDKFTKRQYYVPQREWSERERDERPLDYVKRGGGDNPFNAALRKAKGRKSLASDPLPFIQSIAHSSILSAEKNKTKQAMLKTVKANIAIGRKTGAFDFKQSWLINSKTTDADGNMLYDVVYALPSSELFAEDRETRKEINKLTKQMLEETDIDIIDKLNEKIEELKSNINIATFEVHDNYIRNRTSEEKKQHEVVVISNGDRFVIQYQDEKVANAINRNFNKQTYDNVVMRTLNKGTRYMSGILTQYNPVFALWNFARDYQTAIISHAIDFGAEYEAQFLKNTIISQKAINDYVWKGKFTNSKTGKDLELFFETGAATGWSYLFRIEQLKRKLKNQIDPSVIRSIYNGTTLPFTVMAKAFSNITEVSELSTRFATFKTSIERGYSPEEAASHAKEVTVNFDRSGSSKFFSGIFAFFNAQIQGTNKQYRQSTRTKRGKYAIPAVAFSFFIGGVVNALLSPDDPDEERAWAEYDRMNNMLVGNVKIPLTHFYRTFWGMGTQAVLAYKGEKSVEVAMFDGTSNMLSDLFPQTPLSLWELLDENKATGKLEPDLRKYLQTIAPTATVPMVDVMLNKKFTGAPVAREPFSTKAKEYIPDSQLYNRNVHAFFKGATDAWFTKHGGDIAAKTKGNVPWYGDINPSKVQHIAEGYTGGVGKQLLDLTNFIYGIAKEGAFDETKIPVWNRLVKPYREDKVVAQKYWTLRNKVEYYEQSYNAYRKARAGGSSLSDEKVKQMRDSEKHQLYLEAKTKLHQMDRMMKSERVPSSQDIKELDAYIKQWNKLK